MLKIEDLHISVEDKEIIQGLDLLLDLENYMQLWDLMVLEKAL